MFDDEEYFEENLFEIPLLIERSCPYCQCISYNKIRVCCVKGFEEDKDHEPGNQIF